MSFGRAALFKRFKNVYRHFYIRFSFLSGKPLFLTPLIRAGKIKEAQAKAFVHGAGIDSFVKSYAGYLGVNKDVCESNLFFWFVPATVRCGGTLSLPTL